ncbi:MAG: hypothetical protein HC906_09650 [Bacteroidales bacterium]|nr:hypothetical protein [Bacteroidales bacterium]
MKRITRGKFFLLSYTFLFYFILFWSGSVAFGQTVLFQFDFENDVLPSVNNTAGTPSFTSSGLSTPTYTGTSCLNSWIYSERDWNTNDYYQFTVNTTGFTNLTFSFCHYASNANINDFRVRVSTDGSSWTTLISDYNPPTGGPVTVISPTLPSFCENIPVLYIQYFKTNNPGNANRRYYIDNVVLQGTALFSNTFYSYQSGSWTSPETWTTDPSGTTQVGSSIPGDDDPVVILSDRTVTLPSDISTTNLSITVNEGGILDLSTYRFTIMFRYWPAWEQSGWLRMYFRP